MTVAEFLMKFSKVTRNYKCYDQVRWHVEFPKSNGQIATACAILETLNELALICLNDCTPKEVYAFLQLGDDYQLITCKSDIIKVVSNGRHQIPYFRESLYQGIPKRHRGLPVNRLCIFAKPHKA